jgi:hypothetical protein
LLILDILVTLSILIGTEGLVFAKTSTPSWPLNGTLQRSCFGTAIPLYNVYYVYISRTWTTPLNVTIANWPPHAFYFGVSSASIAPGTSDGIHILADTERERFRQTK